MNNQSNNLPGFCILIDELILEIAKERGRDPDELKQSLLAKIREKEVDTTATVPTSTKREHPPLTKNGGTQ